MALTLVPTGAALAATPPSGSGAGTVAGIDRSVASTTGTLHVAVGDDFVSGRDTYVAKISTDHGVLDVPASVTADLDPSLESGDPVEVTTSAGGTVTSVEPAATDDVVTTAESVDGTSVDRPGAGLSAGAGVTPVAGVPNSGQHYVTVIPVKWGSVPAMSTTGVGAAISNLDAYYNTVSKGRIRVKLRSTTAVQTLNFTPTSANACSSNDVDEALNSVYSSVPANRFEHVVFLMPNPGAWCDFAGYGSVNAWPDGRNHMWLFDASALTNAVFAHEFGHNLGLEHSGAINPACAFSNAKTALPLGSCVDVYGDPWDLMGNSTYAPHNMTTYAPDPVAVGHLSAVNMARLGLLSSTDQRRLTATSTTITLSPVSSGAGLRLVTIPWGNRTYTLEYRAATGLDAWINTPNGLGWASNGQPVPAAGSGVVLRERDGTGANSQDGAFFFHPESGQAAIRAVETKGTVDSSLRIKVNSLSPTAANITVTRAKDTTAPTLGQYGYWKTQRTVDRVGVVLLSTTLDVGYVSAGDADSALQSVQLVVDGKVRATASSTGLTELKATGLSNGKHTWSLVARDLFGNVRRTANNTVHVDTSAPKITSSPRASLTKGTVSTTSVPVSVSWKASDACGIIWSAVAGSNGLSKSMWSAPKAVSTRLTFSRSSYFIARSQDCAANYTSTSKGPHTTATLDKQSKRKGYHGTWTATKAKKALGGTEQVTKKKKAYVSYKVKTRSIGWVATKGKDRGKAAVYIDGKKVATVNLYAKKTTYAQQVFTKTWSKKGTHTIKIVNLSSKKVGVDAFTKLS
ncbi:M12 family metallo-peptidase [Cellulomonas sp. HZM]|uniref:M12 family metallo-peptidase n=1 Tax=Cellulomonas sp. HZM TaxID=1454010 RepID=UPI0012DEE49D|nr:M12 family metallo-peptidase [Cellulomonas sp. HZM]